MPFNHSVKVRLWHMCYKMFASVPCLSQVQQALQRTHWPDELGNMLANRSGPEKTPEPLISGSALSHTSQATAEISIRPQARHSIESNGATSLLGARGDKQIDSVAHQKHGSGPGGDSLANRVSSMLQHLMGKGGSKVSPDLGSEYDASDGHMTMKLDERAPAAHRRSVDSLASYDRATAVTSVSKAAGSTASRLKGKHVKMASGEVLGLRVRMAIASGWVPAGSDIKVSAVFALAKGTCRTELCTGVRYSMHWGPGNPAFAWAMQAQLCLVHCVAFSV